MFIAHNLGAMNAQRQYNIVTNRRAKSSEKLSSGYRINRAADDAAGLAISEKMRRQIRGLSQGVENTQDGVSLCQVADGALAEVSDMLHRITELSVKSANGTNSSEDREYIQEEINQILMEIDRISDSTTFNEQKIFTGELKPLTIDNLPTVLTSSYSGSKQQFIQDFSNVVMDGSDPAITSNTANSILLTKDNLSSYATAQGSYVYLLSPGTYQIDDSISNIALKLSGDVTIHDSELDNVSLVCESCNLTLDNVDMKTDAYTTYSWQGLYFQNSDNTLNFLGENNFEVEWGETAAITVYDANLEINGNGILNINSKGYGSAGIGAESMSAGHGNVTINSGNINITTKQLPSATIGDFQIGIGNFNRNIKSISNLEINGGNINIQSNSNGSPAIAVQNFTLNGGSLLASAADYNRNAFTGDGERNGMGIIADDFTRNGGAILALGGNGLDAQGSAVLIYNSSSDIGRNTTTTDDYYYYSNVSDEYIEEYLAQGYMLGERSVWIQAGTEAGSGMYVDIGRMNTSILGIHGLDVSTVSGANHALDATKQAQKSIMADRSRIGAQQNRLEHTIANEENIVENTTAAESRIRDIDMAKEMVQYANGNILQQVGQAMMAQANQSNQGVLNLLN